MLITVGQWILSAEISWSDMIKLSYLKRFISLDCARDSLHMSSLQFKTRPQNILRRRYSKFQSPPLHSPSEGSNANCSLHLGCLGKNMRAASWERRVWWWPMADPILDKWEKILPHPLWRCRRPRQGQSRVRKPVLATFLNFVCSHPSNEQSALVIVAMRSCWMSPAFRMCAIYLDSRSRVVNSAFLVMPTWTRVSSSQWSINRQTPHSWLPHFWGIVCISAPSSVPW